MVSKTKKHKIYINGRFLTQPISGVQRYAHELIRAWDKQISKNPGIKNSYEFLLLAPKNAQLLYNPDLKTMAIHKVGLLRGHLWEQFELPRFTTNGLLFCPGNTAPILNLLSKNPTVVTIHDLSYKYFPKAYSLPFRLLYKVLMPLNFRYANFLITVSNAEKKAILKYYPQAEKKIYSIQNGGLPQDQLKTIQEENRFKEKLKKPYILYVGALNPRKNPQGLIEAFRQLMKVTDLYLVIVGATNRAFQKLKISDAENFLEHLQFIGQINNVNELIHIYRNAFCLVFPSFYESSGLPPIEAMACNCPVIVSDIPALKERCGDAALYCDPNEPDDIANKILKLLQNKPLQHIMKKKGLKKAASFTWQRCAEKTFELINSFFATKT